MQFFKNNNKLIYNKVKCIDNNFLNRCDYCVVDIETTGLSYENDYIIEIGAIKIINNTIVDTFQTLIKPYNYSEQRMFSVPTHITELTGISDELLKQAEFIKEALINFDNFVKDMLIVGYNVSFDIRFINEAYRTFIKKNFDNESFDVMKLARKLHPEMSHHRLKDMVNKFNIKVKCAHRALYDCYATDDCYRFLKKEL